MTRTPPTPADAFPPDAPLAAPRRRARFLGHRAAVAALAVLAVILAACLAGALVAPGTYHDQNLDLAYRPPSLADPLGADALGRSLAARCAVGGLISPAVGLAAAAISVFLGVAWGAAAAFAGGRIDALMMRLSTSSTACPIFSWSS